jgi:hypothetical protein
MEAPEVVKTLARKVCAMNTRSFSGRKPAVAFAACLALVGLAATARADTAIQLPLDTNTTVDGVNVACTGIGETRNNPLWQDYPVRLEFSDARGDYMADETLTVYRSGRQPLLSVSCDAPWVLMRLPPGGDYRVQASLDEPGTSPHTVVVRVPEHGQARFLIVFPHGY